MRHSITFAVVLLASAALPWSASAKQSAGDAFSSGTKAFLAGDFSNALAYYEAARDAGVEGPAVHYDIGVCNYRLGRYEQAEAEFRLVAGRYPKMRALADYNLGLVLLRENRDGAARLSFEEARRESTDGKITRLADTALQRLDSQNEVAAASPRWVSFVDADVGYDDNVALLDEASLPASMPASSPFRELLAVITGPISSGPGFRFDGSVYSISYDDAGEFDETAARVGGTYGWNAGAWRMEAESHFDYAVLDGSAFEQQLGAGVNLTRPLSRNTVLGIRVLHDQVEGKQTQFSLLDGSREQLGLSWDRYGANNGRLTFAYLHESNDRRSPSVSPSRNDLSMRYRYAMNPVWSADLSLSLRRSVFVDTEGTRNEERTELSIGLRRRFSDSWHLNGAYLWSGNRSNVAAFTYTRNRLSLGLSKDF